ncbi:MAG: YIP1 family protein [Methanosarcinales archaeon]
MTKLVYCKRCGSKNEVDAVFCRVCNEKLDTHEKITARSFLKLIRGLLFSPKKTFREIHSYEDFRIPIIIVIIGSALGGANNFIFLDTLSAEMSKEIFITKGLTAMTSEAILGSIIGLILWIIYDGAITHFFVRLFGGKRGIKTTLRMGGYAETPRLVFGLIFTVIFLILLFLGPSTFPIMLTLSEIMDKIYSSLGTWGLFLFAIGIREAHQLTNTKAFLIIAIPIGLLVVLAFLFL